MKIKINLHLYILVILFLFGLQFGVHKVNAQQTPTNSLPEEERKLRDELELDKSILEVSCRVFFTPEKPDKQFLEARKTRNQIILSILKAATSNEIIAKVKQRCSSIEGTPTVSYLLVNNGKITLVVDSSRDKFGYMRVRTETCSSLSLVHYVSVKDEKGSRLELKPTSESDKDKVTFMLKCEKTGEAKSDSAF